MASPFTFFRRNQRMLLAVSTLMAMLLFVIGDPLSKYFIRGRRGDSTTIVTTGSRSYNGSEMGMLLQSRRLVDSFLRMMAMALVEKAMASGQPLDADYQVFRLTSIFRNELLFPPTVPPDEIPDAGEGEDARRRAAEEAAAIQVVVLADKAESQGFVVTDQAISESLKLMTRGGLTGADLDKVVSRLHTEGRGFNQAFLFEALRRELLAAQYTKSYFAATSAVPPAQRWGYFEELNRRATIQHVAVPVAQFLKDVPEPSDAQLKEFFSTYDTKYPDPASPTPGFKQPARAQFQFFKANWSEFMEKATAQVTPEEIREYYDKQKDIHFRDFDSPTGTESEKPGPSDKPADSSAPTDSSVPTTDTDKPAGTEKPASTEKPTGPDTTAPEPDKKKSSHSAPASPFRPVALVQKTDGKPAASPPAAAAPASSETKDAVADAAPADAVPTDGAPADGSTTADKPEGDADQGGAKDKPSKPELKYKPFEAVEDEIRKTLASEKATKLINDAFDRISSKMRVYGSDYNSYETNKKDDESLTPPEPLDLTALASAEGLEVHDTKEPVSAAEIEADSDLGKSMTKPRADMVTRSRRISSFVDLGFQMPIYKPFDTEDTAGNRYLTWKVKEVAAYVPGLDEVRREVVRAYKMIEARKRAFSSAEQLAKEAREAKKPLKEFFAGREGFEVLQGGPFTWMTIGPVPRDPMNDQPRLSPVHGVDQPGVDFMRAVFESTPEQIRVAFNLPETVAYVVQVESFEPSQSDLERDFAVENFVKYGQLAAGDQRELYLNWLRHLDREAKVTWVNPSALAARGPED